MTIRTSRDHQSTAQSLPDQMDWRLITPWRPEKAGWESAPRRRYSMSQKGAVYLRYSHSQRQQRKPLLLVLRSSRHDILSACAHLLWHCDRFLLLASAARVAAVITTNPIYAVRLTICVFAAVLKQKYDFTVNIGSWDILPDTYSMIVTI